MGFNFDNYEKMRAAFRKYIGSEFDVVSHNLEEDIFSQAWIESRKTTQADYDPVLKQTNDFMRAIYPLINRLEKLEGNSNSILAERCSELMRLQNQLLYPHPKEEFNPCQNPESQSLLATARSLLILATRHRWLRSKK